MSQVPLYDALAADYDRFVNWEGRLFHELPFLMALFEGHSLFGGHRVRRVLDAACGTGQHAIALARRGYQVVGADLSAAMVERARENAAAHEVEVTFVEAGLGEFSALEMTFEAAICLGNSLPHLLSESAVAEALTDLSEVLCPGGLLVIQNRNFDRVWAARERFMPPQSHRDAEGEWLFLRFYDFWEETVTFNMLRLRRTEDGWVQDVDSTELRPIFGDDLARALAKAGFDQVTLYGSYDGSPFEPAESGDLIAVARRAG